MRGGRGGGSCADGDRRVREGGRTVGRQGTDLHGVTLTRAAGGAGHRLSSQTLVKGGLSFHRLEITYRGARLLLLLPFSAKKTAAIHFGGRTSLSHAASPLKPMGTMGFTIQTGDPSL